jgi:hypothetical protein
MTFLFVVGLLVFNPPLLLMFDTTDSIFGLPVLYVYLFLSWAFLVGLAALSMEGQITADEDDIANEGSSVSRLDN